MQQSPASWSMQVCQLPECKEIWSRWVYWTFTVVRGGFTTSRGTRSGHPLGRCVLHRNLVPDVFYFLYQVFESRKAVVFLQMRSGRLLLGLVFIPSSALLKGLSICLQCCMLIQFYATLWSNARNVIFQLKTRRTFENKPMIHSHAECSTHHCKLPISFWGAHKSWGKTTSVCTLSLGLQTNWSELGWRFLWFMM